MAFCGNCGKEINDGVKFCGSCGAPIGAAATAPDSTVSGAAARSAASAPAVNRVADEVQDFDEELLKNVENHMVKAVLSTLLCIPLGVASIVFAARVKPALGAEEYEAALEASQKANFWSNLALIIGTVIYVIQLSLLVVPRFSQASGKAKLEEAPRYMASFESGYLATLAEYGDDANITENELIFMAPDDSKSFKYEYVTYPQGGIAGYKATALTNIGKFNKGNFLQTIYQEDSEAFTHCVGGIGADVSVVEELIPNFNATVECSNVEIKKAITITDSRDGKKYKIVKISNQTWMAENLNYAAKGSKCYENNEANCAKYGRLYNWNTARNACPAGFHLPRDAEWTTLVNNAGGESTAGKKLKSQNGWAENGDGTNEYRFSALPGGIGVGDGRFGGVGGAGIWWSATGNDTYTAWDRSMSYDEENVDRDKDGKSAQFSVRCVQD